jgi:hypothetical protein
MALIAAVSRSQDLDGRLAGSRAARQALDLLGGNPVQFALVTASYQHAIQAVLSGVTAMLGNTPLLGLSVHGDMLDGSQRTRTVQVALLAGEGLQARADLWPGFDNDPAGTVRRMAPDLGLDQPQDGLLLLAVDGLSGDTEVLGAALADNHFPVAGALASGLPTQGVSYQIGGSQAGGGSLAAAWLASGGNTRFTVGMGLAHGWSSVGAVFEVTNVREQSIRTLDHSPAVEIYAKLFGNDPRAWMGPPLNELVRLYPLGIERDLSKNLELHAPLLFEPDGSLRIQSKVSAGSLAHLMLGSRAACLSAARQAAEQALVALQGSRPVFGLIFADLAWQQLFNGETGRVADIIRAILGEELPLLGSYTAGQLARSVPDTRIKPYFQHVMVVLLGEDNIG